MIPNSHVGSDVVGSGSGSPMTHGAELSSQETPLEKIVPEQHSLGGPFELQEDPPHSPHSSVQQMLPSIETPLIKLLPIIPSSHVGSDVGSETLMTHGAELSSHETPDARIDPAQQVEDPPLEPHPSEAQDSPHVEEQQTVPDGFVPIIPF